MWTVETEIMTDTSSRLTEDTCLSSARLPWQMIFHLSSGLAPACVLHFSSGPALLGLLGVTSDVGKQSPPYTQHDIQKMNRRAHHMHYANRREETTWFRNVQYLRKRKKSTITFQSCQCVCPDEKGFWRKRTTSTNTEVFFIGSLSSSKRIFIEITPDSVTSAPIPNGSKTASKHRFLNIPVHRFRTNIWKVHMESAR